MQTQVFSSRFGIVPTQVVSSRRTAAKHVSARKPVIAAAAPAKEELVDEMGFKLMRKGVKQAAQDTILTPR